MSWWDGLKAGVVAWSVAFIVWQDMEFKFLVVWGFVMGIWEIAVQMRWRLDLVCSICDFDPLLYVKNPELASLKVKGKLEQRRSDPFSLMRAPLPVLVDRSKRAKATYNPFLSANSQEQQRVLKKSLATSSAPRSVKSNRNVVPAAPLR
jgi:hypothetical protein